MKKLFLFLFLVCGAMATQAQNVEQLYTGNAQVYRSIDTLTNADTTINYGREFDHQRDYEVHVTAASISGTMLDTLYVEHAAYLKASTTPTEWTLIETAYPISTSNTTWVAVIAGSAGPGTLRIRNKSTGTQSTRIVTTLQSWRKKV